MLPPYLPRTLKSAAERRVFELIHSQTDHAWTALHSLGLAHHPRKPWAELDFVLVGPPGLVCLEVKGGRIARRNGIWYFTDRAGAVTAKHEGPFEQVASGTAALYRHLSERCPQVRDTMVGHAVITPDIEFDVPGPDVDRDLVFDQTCFEHGFGRFLDQVVEYWHERLGRQRGRTVRALGIDDRTAVVTDLRGDFDLRSSLRAEVGQVNQELLRLTEEQFRVLDALEDNRRMMVKAGAGTGKTLLAIEEARRQAESGKRVLLCCYNKNLATFLEQALGTYPWVDIWHLHGFMAAVLREAGRLPASTDGTGEELFLETYPRLCAEALVDLGRAEAYDVLVVDEAQDLMRPAYIDLLDLLLKGNLEEGVWRVFWDPRQSIFGPGDQITASRLLCYAPAQGRLTMNCRNTRQIAVATTLMSGVDGAGPGAVEGPDVRHHWYGDEAQERDMIASCLQQLCDGGLAPEQIVILAQRKREGTCLRLGLGSTSVDLVDLDPGCIYPPKGSVGFSTVGGFKGLEADAVLLIEVGDLSTERSTLATYVGGSRARAVLHVFLHKRCRPDYERRAAEFGQRLVRQGFAGTALE